MTHQATTQSPAVTEAIGTAPHPRKSNSRTIILVLLVVFLLLVTPVVAIVLAGAVWFLTPGGPVVGPGDKPSEVPTLAAEKSAAVPAEEPRRSEEHPLDPALKIAYDGLEHMRKDVDDYTSIIVKRERIGTKLGEEETMFAKIRSRKSKDGKTVVPLGVYMRFLEPKSKAGREVIYVEGQNNDKLVGHETGLLNIARYYLRVNGPVAMAGERYSITDIGVDFLVEELIKHGEKDRVSDSERGKVSVEVKIEKGVELVGRTCTRIEVRHPKKTPEAGFLMAEIYIDEELNVPIRYAAYSWPEVEGGEMVLEEEYTYKDMKVNVGLKDADFDPDNPEYKFPKAIGAQ